MMLVAKEAHVNYVKIDTEICGVYF